MIFSLTKNAYTMESDYLIESKKPFSESLIWQLNRDFYQNRGISAWSDDIVPHHMTSNSKVGKTYAELIFGLLKDLASKGACKEIVYILELGAGHGRLAFHILKHLEKLIASTRVKLPPYCYVLSDIVEENLSFFQDHPQFQTYLQKEVLDVSYFDAAKSKELNLRYAKKTIRSKELKQPILAIANYFFDSIPNDLFLIKDKIISNCSVSIKSTEDPESMNSEGLIENMEITYHKAILNKPYFDEPVLNEILEEYRDLVHNTYLFFPERGIKCLSNLKDFSSAGMILLSMDKGFHEIKDLENKNEPDVVTHGSFSFWVNYHAFIAYCQKQGGHVLFPSYSTFHLEMGCLFLTDGESYPQTNAAYQQFVNNFGPDDFNSIKHLAYFNISRLQLKELLALFRLSAYDSTFFIKLLPRLKHVAKTITYNERIRLAQTMHIIWDMYFNINETFDLAYELGGIFYDLGFYTEALEHFQYSVNSFGQKEDIYYNKALCHYQLREDELFSQTLDEAKKAFPGYTAFEKLEELDMS